jgi:Ca-activated chloride channel family protein
MVSLTLRIGAGSDSHDPYKERETNMSINLAIDVIPGKPVVRQSGGALDILVSVAADTIVTTAEINVPPITLGIVLDRSGSMNGEPLNDAKKVIAQIINGLRPQDRVAVVAYDTRVDIVQPLTHCEQPAGIIERINAIETGGSTNLFGGWEAAAELLLANPGSGLNRVIVISDGCLNAGLTDPIAICDRVGLAATQGVTTSTLGLSSHFDESVMAAMAEAGRGRSHYGQTALDLLASFQEEIELLRAVQATDVKAHIRVLDTNVSATLLSPEFGPLGYETNLQPLVEGGSSWLLIRVEHGALPLGDVELLKIAVTAKTKEGNIVRAEVPVLAVAVVSDTAEAAEPLNPAVKERVDEFDAAVVYRQVREALLSRDRATAERLVAELKASGSTSAFVQANIETLELLLQRDERMAIKELHYSQDRMSRRQLSRDELNSRRNFDNVNEAASFSAEMPAYLRKKRSVGRGFNAPENNEP